MSTALTILFGLIGFALVAWIGMSKRKREARAATEDVLTRSDIKQYQELLGQLRTDNTRKREDFKQKLEAHREKINRHRANVVPIKPDDNKG